LCLLQSLTCDSLDIKKTFTKGFKKLRERLGNRYYVLATTYAHDLSLALSAGIEAEPEAKNTEGSDAHSEQLSSPSKQAAKDRGERIKLARRIVKAIHPHLEAAVRAEADLCQKSGDTLVQELDSILEAAYHARPASLAGSIEALAHDNSDEMAGNTHLLDIREQLEPASKDKVHDSIPSGEPMDIDLHDEDAPGEDVEDDDVFTPIPTSADEPIEDSRVSADIGQTADSSKQLKPDYNDIKSSDTPPDTNGYVAQLGHQHPAPPTPPVSNGGALSSSGQDISSADTCMVLTEGGIPWYLKEFDPIGTTLLEERWTARDAALSEELSEIDDDELRGMGVDIEGVDGEIGAAEGKAETIIRTKRSKVKKRKKGSR
jgi:NuA3 HAT complex component NTO1